MTKEKDRVFAKCSAAAIVKDVRGRMLLVQHTDETWSLPGGGIKGNEPPRGAASREAWEETGLHVTIRKLYDVIYFHWRNPQGDIRQLFLYEAKIHGGKIRPNEEEDSIACRYVGLREIAEMKKAKQLYRPDYNIHTFYYISQRSRNPWIRKLYQKNYYNPDESYIGHSFNLRSL